jgi:hypothetical protein
MELSRALAADTILNKNGYALNKNGYALYLD